MSNFGQFGLYSQRLEKNIIEQNVSKMSEFLKTGIKYKKMTSFMLGLLQLHTVLNVHMLDV